MEDKNKKETTGKKILKISLKALKICLVLGILVGFLGGGMALGMMAAALQDVPRLDRDRLENPALPSTVLFSGGEFMGEARQISRVYLTYDEIPQDLKNAFLATEDNKFYDHPGFDIRGLGRATLGNLQGNSISGGSTITQQLVKQVFLHQGRQMDRKIQELYLALQVEKMYTKEEIMEFYLNSAVHYGANEHGVGAAARSLFGKTVDELTLAEMALLAGIPNLPGAYDPRFGTEEAVLMRRRHVLTRMLRFGYITEEQFQEAISEEIVLRGSVDTEPESRNSGIVDYAHGPYNYALRSAENILMELYDFSRQEARHAVRNNGYTITTTINRDYQKITQDVLNDDRNFPTPYSGPDQQEEGSATLIDNRTGEILALGTGRNADSTNNAMLRPIDSVRSPGSAIKPILSYGVAIEERILFPGSVVNDQPIKFPDNNRVWTPENHDNKFLGLVTVRDALVRSINTTAVTTTQQVGRKTAADFAYNLGLSRYNSNITLASSIGGTGVTALELTSAYSAFGNQGVLAEPHIIKEIVDRHGRVIYSREPQSKVIMSEETAFLISDMLTGVSRPPGTAPNVRNYFTKNAALKTGTSDDRGDIWVVGYTPQYSLGVWIGWDNSREGQVVPIRTGPWTSTIWGKIMDGVHKNIPNTPFTRPNNLVEVAVSTKSGKLPSPITPPEFIKTDYFVRGHEPTEICDAFVEVTICRETGLLASDLCPPHHRQAKVMLVPREYTVTTDEWNARRGGAGRYPEDVKMMAPTKYCDMHSSSGANSVNPSNLTTTLTGNGIRLRWNASNEATGFNVYRKTDDTEFTLLNSTPINVKEFLDVTVLKDVEYTYYVTAITSDGSETRGSNTIKVTLSSAVQRVTDFNLSLRNNRVELSWEPALNATRYRIYRSTEDASNFTEIEKTNRTTFVDRNVQPNNTYFYYIVAEGAEPSPTKSIKTSTPGPGNGLEPGNGNGDDNGNSDDNDSDNGDTDDDGDN